MRDDGTEIGPLRIGFPSHTLKPKKTYGRRRYLMSVPETREYSAHDYGVPKVFLLFSPFSPGSRTFLSPLLYPRISKLQTIILLSTHSRVENAALLQLVK